jgi:hypothetical protein
VVLIVDVEADVAVVFMVMMHQRGATRTLDEPSEAERLRGRWSGLRREVRSVRSMIQDAFWTVHSGYDQAINEDIH